MLKKLLAKLALAIVIVSALSIMTPLAASAVDINDSVETEYRPTIIPKPDTLPGINPSLQESEGGQNLLLNQVIPRYTIILIGVVAGLALTFTVIGGVRFTTAYGNEEAVDKAKKQVIFSLVALVAALLAFTLVTAITNFSFFGDQTQRELPQEEQEDFETAPEQNPFNTFNLFPTAYAISADELEQIDQDFAEENFQISCQRNSDCSDGELCQSGVCQDLLNTLTPRFTETGFEEVDAVSNLPDITIENALTTIIRTLLAWAMILTLIAIVVAAFFYLTALGEEDKLNKSKSIILYLLIGLLIMAGAYGIVGGLTQFNPFASVVYADTIAETQTIAYTIPDYFRPINEPFNVNDEIRQNGAATATVIILQVISGGLLFFAAPVAIVFIVLGAFNLVIGSADTEKIDQAKKHLTWSIAGLFAIILSYALVRSIINVVLTAASTAN